MGYEINKSPIELSVSEMPQNFIDKAERIGLEAANSLLWFLPGFQIVSVPVRFKKFQIKMQIVEEYDGSNRSALAVRFKMSRDDVLRIYNKYTFKTELKAPKPCKYMDTIAEKCGGVVADLILENYSGESFNIPSSGKRIMIAKVIRREFSGDNHVQLAAKHRISVMQVYRIV